MNLVQELRAQLERVVRDPGHMFDTFSSQEVSMQVMSQSLRLFGVWDGCTDFQAWRIAILTAAIRAAVVTREAQP